MCLRSGPMSLAQAKEMREKIRPVLRRFEADFDRMKKRFLMLDRFPQNGERFPRRTTTHSNFMRGLRLS